MKTKKELEEAIKDAIIMYKELFLVQIPPSVWHVWMNFENEQAIDQDVYDQKLMEDMMRKLAWEGLQKNIIMDGDTMIDKRTGEVLGPETDSTYCKDKF